MFLKLIPVAAGLNDSNSVGACAKAEQDKRATRPTPITFFMDLYLLGSARMRSFGTNSVAFSFGPTLKLKIQMVASNIWTNVSRVAKDSFAGLLREWNNSIFRAYVSFATKVTAAIILASPHAHHRPQFVNPLHTARVSRCCGLVDDDWIHLFDIHFKGLRSG